MSGVIVIRDLNKNFRIPKSMANALSAPQRVAALDGVSLTVRSGDILALVGPNGSGKTTLLKILCSLVLPDSGSLKIEGKIGYAGADERSFYARLTGRQNLRFFAALYGLRGIAASQKIDALSSAFGVQALDRKYQEYSTGMKQRLALTRAFLTDAPVILLDEPSRSLDPDSAESFFLFVKAYAGEKSGRAVLFTTHRLDEARRFATHVAALERGRLISAGKTEEIYPPPFIAGGLE